MKFCQGHWDALRKAIEARGLSAFVAKGGEAAAARLATAGENGSSRATFEPLTGAHLAYVSNALDIAGLAIMQPNEDGSDRCPVCYLAEQCQCPDRGTPQCAYVRWLDCAADDQLAEAKRLGLVGDS